MNKMILIKYGELTTKKGNRSVFTKLLANNVKAILRGLDYKVTFDRVRMYVECTNLDEAINRLKNVFVSTLNVLKLESFNISIKDDFISSTSVLTL